jgi:mannosyltransferase
MGAVSAQLKDKGYLVFAAVLSLAFSLRGITTLPLSHDEFYTLHALTQGLATHVWEAPLLPYYGLMWLWSVDGNLTSDVWLRLPSTFAVVGAAVATAAVAARLHTRRAGFVAAILMALSAAAQRYGQDARPYALGMGLFALATYLMVRGIQQDSRGWWILYAITIVVGGAIVPQGLVVVIAHGMYVLLSRVPRATARNWALAASATIPLLVAGATFMLIDKFPMMHNWVSAPTLLDLPTGIIWVGEAGATSVAASSAYGLALVLMAFLSHVGRSLILGTLTGALLIWLVSIATTSFWMGRSFLPLVPMAIAAAAISLASLSYRSAIPITLILCLTAIPAYTAVRLPRTGEADMRKAVEIVASEGLPGTEIFGDSTDAYGLAQAWLHYGTGEQEFTVTRDPQSRYWTVYGSKSCVPEQTWELGGNATLRLCSSG